MVVVAIGLVAELAGAVVGVVSPDNLARSFVKIVLSPSWPGRNTPSSFALTNRSLMLLSASSLIVSDFTSFTIALAVSLGSFSGVL